MGNVGSVRLDVSCDSQGMRLDHFLARQFPHISRVVLRRATAEGRIRVNDQPSRSNYRLRGGDIVTVEINEAPSPGLIPEPIPLTILFEDEHLLVVDKPGGMLVHPTRTVTSGTLLNALSFYLQNQHPPSRPGLVHRLDRGTSGLVVVAKTEQAHRVLARHFRERRVSKYYLALVGGTIAEDTFDITWPIGWVADRYPHWWVVETGRPALTMFAYANDWPDSPSSRPKRKRDALIRFGYTWRPVVIPSWEIGSMGEIEAIPAGNRSPHSLVIFFMRGGSCSIILARDSGVTSARLFQKT